jgi:hypothetical protein
VIVDRRHFLFVALTVITVALAAAPAAVVFGLGWLSLGSSSVSAARAPEAWALFALFYLAWMLALMVALIVANDRLGRHWRSWDRAPRTEKKARRRLAAGMRYLAGQEKARVDAGRDAARARAAGRPPRAPRGEDDA